MPNDAAPEAPPHPPSDRPGAPAPADSSEVPAKSPLRRGRLAAVALAVGAAALWFAPAFVARSDMRHSLVERALPGVKAHVGRASLSWLGEVKLRDVRLVAPDASEAAKPDTADSRNRPLLTVAEIRTDQPLHALLAAALFGGRDAADYGTVTLVEPALNVRLRSGGSDLEDVLAPWLTGQSSGPPPGYVVVVEDGSVRLVDPTGRHLEGRTLSGSLNANAGDPLPAEMTLEGVWGDGERTGRATASLATDEGDGTRNWTLNAETLPLTAAIPLLSRFAEPGPDGGAGWTLDGALSGDLSGTFAEEGWSVSGTATGARLTARGVDWPATDRLRVAAASLSGRLERGPNGLRAKRIALTSDLLTATADGSLPQAFPADWADLLKDDRRVTLDVDAAALAEQTPGLLGLAENVRAPRRGRTHPSSP
ncbi:MAG: hypothetical protein AAF907_04640 [Planctomycetota bacterium]